MHTWWRHQNENFPRYWPFVRVIHQSPVNSPPQRPVTRYFDVLFDLRLNNGWVNNRYAGDLRPNQRQLWRHCNVCRALSGLLWLGASRFYPNIIGLFQYYFDKQNTAGASRQTRRIQINKTETKITIRQFHVHRSTVFSFFIATIKI